MKVAYRLAVTLLAALAAAPAADAMELLTFPNFETPAVGEVPGWQLLEFRSANPATTVNSAELVGFADNPLDPLNVDAAHRGLWLRPFVGSVAAGTVDAILSQTVAATPGKTYSFAGDGRFETNYLGGLGEPGFRTEFEMAFLDSNGAVIGSPLVRDLTTEVINGLGYSGTNGNPDITPLVGVAPAGAASVRVRAQGLNMTTNTVNGGQQSAFVDNFTLTTSDAPTTELLDNASLNSAPPSPEDFLNDFWTFGEVPVEQDSLQVIGFAQSSLTGGTQGIWVRPFLAGAQGGTATVSQVVDGSAGVNYTFSAEARFEAAFVGDASTTGENATSIVLSFLDSADVEISSVSLNLRDDGKTSAANNWTSHSVSGVAPAGTAKVKVAGVTANLTNNTAGGAQSAFWDNFSLTAATTTLPGDANGDGNVDLLDLDILGANFGAMGGATNAQGDFNSDGNVDLLDLDILGANFGSGGGAVALAVPEPAGALLVLAGLAAVGRRR